ncbi:hypothetical protein IU433_00560 [Nocardia puris]|uniref:PPE family protein n=2 Tax=Nocardia puris TaxID=208602 RepID=A0A366DWN1_9NOCA|nr:hypothetical protein [Nocardia puris]MBF6210275.1 hypothetical protein [Nocardia puris]MBF6367351.1 hypothetical protein [Nocardia puris]MBF6457536.1 hypothetical protein [Nocardia puris]RBO93694.1 hypothetical protein DFR74_102111 [Nocardia puris]
MRRLSGLRRRRPAEQAAESLPVVSNDPTADPPLIAALVQPMLQLRASLGTGATLPDRAITAALSTAATHAADSEGPHREGLHALESTWTSRGADAAVPALRTTQTEIGEISDRGPAYLSVLGDAQATSARAARRVDQIIADFRADARRVLAEATTAPDTDAVIDLAAMALRDALVTVDGARTEMNGHTRRLDEMGPLTVTRPGAFGDGRGGTDPSYAISPGTYGTIPGTNGQGQQLDPAQLAQLQLQRELISAGVELGTSAISAGVDIGTHLIDKIVEVGTHAMDTVAASADKVIDKAIPELINPGSTTNNGAGTPGGGQQSSPSRVIDFGGGAAPGGGGTTPGQNAGGARPEPPKPSSPPATSVLPAPAPQESAPAPRPDPAPSGQPGGAHGGVAMPPPGGGDQDRRPRDGQLGVTIPASALIPETATVPAAVIGDFGDDAP